MAEVTKNVLKGYFIRGAVPTQGNYADLIDTLASKSEVNTAISGVNQSVTATEQDIATIVSILGKGQNETLTQLAAKFTALTGNYANVYAFVSKVKAFLEDADATDTTINRWQEIESFLQGVTDSDSLTAMLADLKSEIEGDLSIDSALNATSEHALQNKTLYNELRVTEQSGSQSTVTIDGTTYPIVVLDANDFNTKSGSDYTVYVLPTLDTDKAYKIIHSDSKDFIANGSGMYTLRFCGNDANDFSQKSHVGIAEILEGQPSTGASISSDNDWNTIEFDELVVIDEEQFYGVPVDGYGDKITSYEEATETTGSASVVKSLKQKIAELETRLAAVPTNYLELATDMSAYTSAPIGKVVMYLGETTQDFHHLYVYEKTASGWVNRSVSPVIS